MADLPYAKKSLGQHWLSDKVSLEGIVNSANIDKNSVVLEIGPGAGTLTSLLVQKADCVIAVEFDETLASQLSQRLGNPQNLEVINQDILKFNLHSMPQDYIIVANIPYYLTGKLIRILCESQNQPKQVVLLVQKEVAERLGAAPGQMSLLSVSAQVYFDIILGRDVPAKLFTPAPKVDSQVVIMHRRKEPLIAKDLQLEFFSVLKAGFSERRKKLRSSLSGGLRISKQNADEIIKSAGIDPNSRAQELSINDWQNLAIAYRHIT